ncbi:MAG: hypothetical protein DRJ01_06690 [Bacteroidetes bacterium]|nr:MAG: hypothetical protein DRJ01_06690 [Bacteroidota bacterium]
MIKAIEALVAVKFIHQGNKVFQHFIVEKKKGASKYILDTRFLVYDKFIEKVREQSLSHRDSSSYQFLERRDEEDRIVLEFKTENRMKWKNYYFVIPGFVSETPGCEFCRFRQDNSDEISFYCSYKEKTFAHKLKNCQFFRQEEGLFKT